jgi:hypothetical protein
MSETDGGSKLRLSAAIRRLPKLKQPLIRDFYTASRHQLETNLGLALSVWVGHDVWSEINSRLKVPNAFDSHYRGGDAVCSQQRPQKNQLRKSIRPN